jgi:two-component system, NarL family, invasion response regulator UvrY
MHGSSRTARILLADNHEIVRKGLRHILAGSLRGATYGEGSTPGQIIRMVRDKKWDLVILGVSIPERGGLEVLKDIRKLRPDLPVLVLSLYTGELLAVRALRAGASGYVVTRQTTSEDIVTAVRKIIAGGQFVSQSLAERLAREIRSGGDSIPHEGLSDREFQVFQMLSAGFTVKEVGERLHLSPQTVSTYRGRILEKMQMETTADFVRYAVQHRLLDECFGPTGA